MSAHVLADLASQHAELRGLIVGLPEDRIAFVPDRPGHDFRYGVADDRLRALGWTPAVAFDEGLAETVAWYRDHLEPVLARTP